MNTYLYGACGNEGCLSCTPAYIIEGDTPLGYEAKVILEKLK